MNNPDETYKNNSIAYNYQKIQHIKNYKLTKFNLTNILNHI